MKVWSSTIGSDIGLVRGSVVGGLFIPALGIDLSYHFSSTSDGADQLTCIKIFAARSWNIYRDFLLKPRFRVRLRIADRPTISPDRPRLWWSLNSKKVWGPYLALRVVNFGPGLLVVTAAVIRIKSGTKISVERVLAEKLGTELEKGQLVNILIPNRDECILDKNPLAIGIRDSFGRVRWAPTEDLKRVQREHAAGPPPEPTGTVSF